MAREKTVPTSTSPTGIPKIKVREKLAYSLGDIASNVVWSGVSALVTYYYTDAVGIAAGTAALIFLISRIFDGISDIVMGFIVDKTKSKYGKARPWLLWMAVPFFIATTLLFAVQPGWSPVFKIVYAFITYNLLSTVCYTAINLPYGVMTTMITDDPKDRMSLNVFRMIGALLMTVVVTVAVRPLIVAFGGELGDKNPMAWTIVFGILGLLASGLFLLCFLGTKERVVPVSKETVPVKTALSALVINKYWFISLLVNFFAMLINGTMGINIYFATVWLGDGNLMAVLMILQMIPLLICMPFAASLAAKWGKRRVIVIGLCVAITGGLLLMINPSSMIFVALNGVLKGIGFSPIIGVGGVLLSDVIDYGEWKFGVRSEGVVYSASSFGAKVGSGVGAAIVGWALAAGLYDPALGAAQAEPASRAILFCFALVPVIIDVIAIIVLSFYDLDKKLPQIRAELAERLKAIEEA